MEEQLAAAVGKGPIAQLVEDDEVNLGELLGQPVDAPCAGFGHQLVDSRSSRRGPRKDVSGQRL